MKKIIFVFSLFIFGLTSHIKAQVYSPQLIGHYGAGTILYPFGYYQGNVTNGVANGEGTFYYRDGSFYHGSFKNGFWHGKGVMVSPFYGYIIGYWSRGIYTRSCQTNNNYNDNKRVKDIISDVQYEKPDNPSYSSISPEGYKVKRIDAETKMGQTLLGSYRRN